MSFNPFVFITYSHSHQINGDAIYGTKPWSVAQNQSDVNAFYTNKNNVTLCFLRLRHDGEVQVLLLWEHQKPPLPRLLVLY